MSFAIRLGAALLTLAIAIAIVFIRLPLTDTAWGLLLFKTFAGFIAAAFATYAVFAKNPASAPGSPRLPTDAVIAVLALWIALIFSTTADFRKYFADKESAASDKVKQAALNDKLAQIKLAQAESQKQARIAQEYLTKIEDKGRRTLGQLNQAQTALERVQSSQKDAAKQASITLGQVRTANGELKKSNKTLVGVAGQQAVLAGQATKNLRLADEAVTGISQALDRLQPSETLLQPRQVFVHLLFRHDTTSEELKKWSDDVRKTVADWELKSEKEKDHGPWRHLTVENEAGRWTILSGKVCIFEQCSFLTSLVRSRQASRVGLGLVSGRVRVELHPELLPGSQPSPEKLRFESTALLMHPLVNGIRDGNAIHVDRPSSLEIQVDRSTGDIEIQYFLPAADSVGSIPGVHTFDDLEGLELDLDLPYFQSGDNPDVTYLRYNSDRLRIGPPKFLILAKLGSPGISPPGALWPGGVRFRHLIAKADVMTEAQSREFVKRLASTENPSD